MASSVHHLDEPDTAVIVQAVRSGWRFAVQMASVLEKTGYR